MTTEFYESDSCSEQEPNNFSNCNTLYGIGNNIDNIATYSSWETLKDDTLKNYIPFLVERKFRYYNVDTRNVNSTGVYNISEFDFFNTTNHNIQVTHNDNTLQPDDVIKENIVNNFTDKLFTNSKTLYQNLLFKLTNTQGMVDKLKSYYDDDIVNLKKEVIELDNNKLKEENTYSSKYYKLKNYETNINILINSIFIVSLIFVIGILTNNGIIEYGYIINIILLIVLVIYLLLSIKNIKDRQYSNWDKRYFDYVNDISDKV